jgi:hypothetical protein
MDGGPELKMPGAASGPRGCGREFKAARMPAGRKIPPGNESVAGMGLFALIRQTENRTE